MGRVEEALGAEAGLLDGTTRDGHGVEQGVSARGLLIHLHVDGHVLVVSRVDDVARRDDGQTVDDLFGGGELDVSMAEELVGVVVGCIVLVRTVVLIHVVAPQVARVASLHEGLPLHLEANQ